VYTSAHDPLSVIADFDTLAGFLEFEILQKLNPVRIFAIILETSLSLSGQPFGERSGCRRARDSVYWHCCVVADSHRDAERIEICYKFESEPHKPQEMTAGHSGANG